MSDDEETENEMCERCSGTGLGQRDGGSCADCLGTGIAGYNGSSRDDDYFNEDAD